MLLSLFLFIFSLTLLYLSSHSLITHLVKTFYRLSRSHETAVNLLFFLLLPGISLHEFSHILTAELLQVSTGHLSLKPHFKNNQLMLGSAQIASTDPFRLTLIGTAPFLTGTLTLYLILRLGLNLNLASLTLTNFLPQILSSIQQLSLLPLLGIFYLLFSISNTMFSSPSDLQAAGLPIVLLLIILGTFKLANLIIPPLILTSLTNLFLLLATIFTLILILNLLLLFPLKLLQSKS